MGDHSVLFLAGICLLTCCAIMVLVWLWACKINNAGVVDIFWAYNFLVIAVILVGLANGDDTRKLLICGMMGIAGFRLGTHLMVRVVSHLDEEEGRYKQLRSQWAPGANAKFFWFFQAQAFSNVLLAVPFFFVVVNKTEALSIIEYIGVAIWLVGFAGEALADWQLNRFKSNPANKGKVCDKGLWNYSRHPNYFFEWVMWLSYFVFALASPYGYLGIISPAIILYLLLRVTGIPATEEQAVRSKGDLYRAYQKTTSVFVPWFKR